MTRIRLPPGIICLFAVIAVWIGCSAAAQCNTNPPSSTVKLIFLHHSTGENWLRDVSDGDETAGGLGPALMSNNYFVSDTNYGWGPDSVGDRTDIGNWYEWFRGTNSGAIMASVYAESGQNCWYSRLETDPGGANRIVMFKSCFPNSKFRGNQSDPIPPIETNPLVDQGSWSEDHTISNAKGIYLDLRNYFIPTQSKLFIVIAAPPWVPGESTAGEAANARAFNNWLSTDYMAVYPYHNLFVFDFYNVLTSNGGNATTNDLGTINGNHHRWYSGAIQHSQTVNNNFNAYDSGDGHPTSAAGQKATGEYLPLLNIAYHCWQGDGGCPRITGSSPIRVPHTFTPTRIATTSHGTNAVISWDAQRCASANYHILYGFGSGLPTWTLHDTPTPPCPIGTTGSYTWTGVPDPAAHGERFLWFLVVGDDGGSVEGSWGLTSAGAERGTGASTVCGKTARSTALTCLAP